MGPAVAALIALTAAGCAQGTSDKNTSADYGQKKDFSGTLSTMGFGAVDEIATTRLDRAKKDLGSGIKVKLAQGDLDIQQFLSAVAAGDPPGLVYADRTLIGTFAARGAIVPLDDCIKGEDIDTSVFDKAALGQVTFDDKVYGIPEFNVVQVIQADQTLMQKAGVTLDDVNGSDWDALSKANRAMSEHQGGKVSVIGFDSKLPEFLPLWAHANGTDIISSDGRTAQLDDPKVVQALEFAVSIYDDQGGFGGVKAFRDQADFFGDQNQFATHTLGAMPMEQWYINVLNDVSPDVKMAFDTFRDRQGEPLAWSSGSAWAIPKGSPQAEAACRFAKVMTETDSWVAAAQARVDARKKDGGLFTGVLTGNTEADQKIKDMVKPSGNQVWDSAVKATYDANEHTFALPANPAGQEFESAWQDAVNRVLNGQQEPQAAMEQAQKEGQAALDQAWKKFGE